MRYSVFPALLATPALAHEATLPHAHTDWGLPVGLCLIALVVAVAAIRSKVRVRK